MNPEKEQLTDSTAPEESSTFKVPVNSEQSDTQSTPNAPQPFMPTENSVTNQPDQAAQASDPAIQQSSWQNQTVPAAAGDSPIGTHITTGSNTAAPVTARIGHHSPRFGGKKRLFAATLAVVLFFGLGAGYVFAFYIPNKPENVWKSAITNTGKAYDMLTEYATKNKAAQSYKVSGAYSLKGALVSEGSMSGDVAGQNSQLSGNFAASGVKLGFDVRTIKSTGQVPDLYFKLTGLESLGAMLGAANPNASSLIGSVNGQWFSVDHTVFDKAGIKSADIKFTKADVEHLLKVVGTVSKEYLFTADPQKAVIVVKDTVGAEKKDGRNTYHYKVGYDSAHLGAYAEALCKTLNSDKVISKLIGDSKPADCAQISKQATNNKSTATTDVWVDKRTKLIHVVRFADSKKTSDYFEVSQDYQGGDDVPFGLKFHSDGLGTKTDVTMNNTLNMKTNTFSVKGAFSYGGASKSAQNETGTFNLNVTPSNSNELKVEKPKNAKSLMELLNKLGLGSFIPQTTSSYTGIQGKARDTERKTDLATLNAYINVSMANNNGARPTLAQLNSASWRAKNIPGFNNDALKDPEGKTAVLVASPKAKSYAYVVGSGRAFSLVAILSDGTQYKISG